MGDVGNKVLYCAPTNAAVDEMTRRLLKFNQGSSSSKFKGKIKKIAYFVFVFFCFQIKTKKMLMQLLVLRMGSWARLHPDVKEATLEDKLAKIRSHVKHENPFRKDLRLLKEKLVNLQSQKESIIKELNQDVCIRKKVKFLRPLQNTLC
jgi:hypothetical protein